MNIFFLHLNPILCAMYHVDRHCVKMILETLQMLCTAIQVCTLERGGTSKEAVELLTPSVPTGSTPLYKYISTTHKNHPCTIWARKSRSNWVWLWKLGIALCLEYTHRYGKRHQAEDGLRSLCILRSEIPKGGFQVPPQAMPDMYKNSNTIRAYRRYYLYGKRHLHLWKGNRHAWTNRTPPKFVLRIYPDYSLMSNKRKH